MTTRDMIDRAASGIRVRLNLHTHTLEARGACGQRAYVEKACDDILWVTRLDLQWDMSTQAEREKMWADLRRLDELVTLLLEDR
ncbi:MAG: hypothetical protein GY876_10555 [Planctomycetes bacterium]|nr:hypothetical protein [Planctomycetota bacterium]